MIRLPVENNRTPIQTQAQPDAGNRTGSAWADGYEIAPLFLPVKGSSKHGRAIPKPWA